ncbi:MAG: GUN4 domain-containing protein [Gomphosphaeria aponina SAG 52.96 = DSM 107014]|uniref:GUN4 domain-containing protein n=1 Tax=Gomphosphaeria aponina SAG 52.96 = DSM 107014 TaxID=1521640 RepID=A0A941GY86_9CHRO|nr:GUN4 domain-containing protein [Gomphosphaeria aponina SAG 52.96 = DSM 107014]
MNLVSSETGVDYTQLKNLLAAGEWEEADQVTYDLMVEATNREDEGWMDSDSYQNFPREDLKIIDNLWVKYSDGEFGFSVQKKIWIEVGGTPGEWDEEVYRRFADRIGWREGGSYLSYSELTFNRNAPEAHLPCLSLCYGRGVW